MIVYKFGGTSLADADRIRRAARLVRDCGDRPVVVVSALAGVTDQLVALAEQVAKGAETEVAWRLSALRRRHEDVADALLESTDETASVLESIEAAMERLRSAAPPPGGEAGSDARLADEVTAVGEDLSAALMAAALRQEGLTAEVMDARKVVRTDDRFGGAALRDDETAKQVLDLLGPLLDGGVVPVLQGFVGATDAGVTTTLGRGGSDFTAAIIGAALGADVSLWTDVDGVMSAEPEQVEKAEVLPELGYEEAVELTYFGARVIHPAAAKHAAARDISLRVRNAQRPEGQGTLIRHDQRRAVGVAAVACKPSVTLIKVRSRPKFMAYGFLARVFDVLARHRTPVDLVATSHTSTSFTVHETEELDDVQGELRQFAEVEVVPDLATVSVVGHGLLRQLGIAARVFSTLSNTSVHLISQASDVSLSFLVSAADAPGVVRRLHAELIESRGPRK